MMYKRVFGAAPTVALALAVGAGTAFGQSSLRDQMIAKAKEEGATVVVAGSNALEIRDKLPGFSERYPFVTVKAVGANTSDTINRVVTEAAAGRLTIDLVAVGAAGNEPLAKRGLLQKFEWPHLKDMEKGTQPKHGLYVDIGGNLRVQGVYNTNLIKPEEVPQNWEDMLDPKWKGMTMISRSAEEFPARLAYLWRDGDKLNWERAFDFYTKLVKNQDPVIGRGYSGGNQRVAAGEIGIFWFPAIGQAVRLGLKGAPVGLIAFHPFPITYRSLGILKGAPHPASAWLLVDYLMSPEGQHEYTGNVTPKIPLNTKAEPGKLAKWMLKNGATPEKGVFSDPSETTEFVYTPEVLKKSEDFYFKLLGIR